jgi:ribosomal protein L18
LPPETPVEVRTDSYGKEVVITAEVAAALEVLESPSEFIGAIFEDPAQALLALASIGADMSEEERKQSTETVLAAVIVGQIATQSAVAAAASAAAASTTYRRKP